MKKIKLMALTAGLTLTLAACSTEVEKESVEKEEILTEDIVTTSVETEVEQNVEEDKNNEEVVQTVTEEPTNSIENSSKPVEPKTVTTTTTTTTKKTVSPTYTSTEKKEPVQLKDQPKEVKTYIEEGTNYRGYGENIDVILEEYSSNKIVYGIYYIGTETISDSKVEYTIKEERGQGAKNPVHSGSVVLNNNYAQVTVNCNGICAEFPSQIHINLKYDTEQMQSFVEDYSLEKYTE